MLSDIEVLQSNCQCIGNPVALPLTEIMNTNQPGKGDRTFWFRSSTKVKLETSTNDPSPSARTPVIHFQQENLKKLSASNATEIDKDRIININTLNPYVNKLVNDLKSSLRSVSILLSDGQSKFVLVIKLRYVPLQIHVAMAKSSVAIWLIT